MPILVMALAALAVFILIGVLCFAALTAEHRERARRTAQDLSAGDEPKAAKSRAAGQGS